MSTYFDAAADTARLRPENRAYADLANLAADVEKDVIEAFTVHSEDLSYTAQAQAWLSTPVGEQVTASTNQLYVALRGYKADAADAAVDADLKDALKRTVAEVIDWRIALRTREQAIASTGAAGVSRAYLAESRDLFPRSWRRHLYRFDLRRPAWGM